MDVEHSLRSMNDPAGTALTQRAPIRRIVIVTAGLAALGATGGAIAGSVAALIADASVPGTSSLRELFLDVEFGTMFGAPLGAVLLPIAGWTLMRRIALWRALAWTISGTIVGGAAGWFLSFGHQEILRTLAGGTIGFLVAVLVARRVHR